LVDLSVRPSEILRVVNAIRLALGGSAITDLPYEGTPCEPDDCIVARWTGTSIGEDELLFEERRQAVAVAASLRELGFWMGDEPTISPEHSSWALPLPMPLYSVVARFDTDDLTFEQLVVRRAR
jgi:hypothetical protein